MDQTLLLVVSNWETDESVQNFFGSVDKARSIFADFMDREYGWDEDLSNEAIDVVAEGRSFRYQSISVEGHANANIAVLFS